MSGFLSTFPWDGRFYYDLTVYVGDLFTCVFALGFLLLVFLDNP